MEKKPNKILVFLDKWGMVIAIPLLLLTTLKSCGTSADLSRLRKENKVIEQKYDSLSQKTVNKEEFRDIVEETMLDFLIYEDELDSKKITISQIKDKIKENK